MIDEKEWESCYFMSLIFCGASNCKFLKEILKNESDVKQKFLKPGFRQQQYSVFCGQF